MGSLTEILLIFFLLFVLVKSADLVQESMVTISKAMNLSPFLVGFVVLALASSLPELSVALTSAATNVPELSLGNLIGSSIVVLSLIIGSTAIKAGSLPFTGSYSLSSLLLTLGLISTQVIVLLDGELSRDDGILLITGYIVVTAVVLRKVIKLRPKKRRRKKVAFAKLLAFSAVGVLGLLIASNLLVETAVDFSESLGISKTIVGMLLFSIGTNLPELTMLLRSNTVDKSKLAVGNFVGVTALHIPALGLLAIISPHQIANVSIIAIGQFFLALCLILFALFATTGKEIQRREGYLLVSLYLAWVFIESVNAIILRQ